MPHNQMWWCWPQEMVIFDLLLHKIRKDYDVLAEVYGVRQLTAKSLIDSASKFIAITDNLLL